MYQQRVTVTYVDETSKEVLLTQWGMSVFAQYANKAGWVIDMNNPGLMAVVMLRYQAYAEMHRDPQGAKPTFERWDMTVSSVDPIEEAEEVTPTETAPSVD